MIDNKIDRKLQLEAILKNYEINRNGQIERMCFLQDKIPGFYREIYAAT